MPVQAQWHDMTWELSPDRVRTMRSMSTSRSLDVEKTEDSEGQPPSQTVKVNLQTLNVDYTASIAQGIPPRAEYGNWWNRLGQAIHAPFYLGGEQYLGCEFLLKEISFDPQVIDANGQVLVGDISLTFEEWAEEESGLKQDYRNETTVTPGVQDYYGSEVSSALEIGASYADKVRMRELAERGF